MFKSSNFCHVASNNRNNVKAGLFVYRTTDDLTTVTTNGYFNGALIDLKQHDLIIHEKYDASDATKVEHNLLCVTEKTLDTVKTSVIKSNWEKSVDEAIASMNPDLFVKKDGSSVMTGPLKFSAGSMRGAVAGGLNGVMFFKMDSQGDLTQIGSLSDTQFVPAADNTLDIGTTVRKVERIYLGKVNNGYDIDVPVTNSSDTLALKSEVDDAANSGEQLYTTGVWYAKMYSATTIPTSAEVEGRNYADFSQVDTENKPIIVVYTYTSGAWVLTETITPPKTHNGYMTITSKIWGIQEQAGQQGGKVLWSHNQGTFTPFPLIISYEDIAVSGESTVAMPQNPVDGQIVNVKYVRENPPTVDAADKSLSNLTSTGANIPNWSTNVSNCIVEIPQDIKIEKDLGDLVLRAGSKVYVPNGDSYDIVTIQNDIYVSIQNITGKVLVFYDSTAGTARADILATNCIADEIITPTANSMIFDETNNIIDYYDGTSTAQGHKYSLPLAEIVLSSGSITSIENIFNGIGYMGNVNFVLPGLKALAADGLNSDGSLKSSMVSVDEVTVSYASGLTSGTEKLVLEDNGIITQYGSLNYDYKNNIVLGNKAACILSENVLVNSKISQFTPKQVFHAGSIGDNTLSILKSQTGYVRLPNGILIQWGTESASSSGEKTVTFPVPFSSATSYAITKNYMSNGSDDIMCKEASFYSLTATSAKTTSVNTNSTSYQWIAIGY